MDNNGSFARRVIFTLLIVAALICIGTFYQLYKSSSSSNSGSPTGSGLLPDGQCLSQDKGVVDCATITPDAN